MPSVVNETSEGFFMVSAEQDVIASIPEPQRVREEIARNLQEREVLNRLLRVAEDAKRLQRDGKTH
jgi:hypothetical protein